MIRLNRAGREQAIIVAIKRLEAEKDEQMFTRGEICRKMGIKSTSRIRDILLDMCERGYLVRSDWWKKAGQDTVPVFGIALYIEEPLPEREYIIINGVKCNYAGEVIENA